MTFHVVVGAGPPHPRIELVAADATTQLTPLTEGAATLINCASPPYDRLPEEAGAGLVNLSNTYGYGPVDGQQADDLPLRPTVMDWSRTAATFDLKPTPLDDVLREMS
jgi:hypothetical protein